jgi:hypothetical protein
MLAQTLVKTKQFGGSTKMEKYIVTYAKITMDKTQGVQLHGVFFGGIGNNWTEAELIAKECVNTIRGGTIIPKIVHIKTRNKLIAAMDEATNKFEKLTKQMSESDNIMKKAQERKKKK